MCPSSTPLQKWADDFRIQSTVISQREVEEQIHTLLTSRVRLYDVDFRFGFIKCESERPWFARELPSSYGVKGGAARILLASVLKLDSARRRKPRDIDLVRIGRRHSRDDWHLATRYMADDAEHGNGVELISSIPSYLRSRDLTINEVIYLEGKLVWSFQCLFDTFAQILRPSRYKGGSLHRPKELAGLTAAKMVRLKVEYAHDGSEWILSGLPDSQYVTPLHLAVHLDRALTRGEEVACRYLELCRELELLNGINLPRTSDLRDYIEAIAHGLPEGVQFFRNLSLRLRKELGE